MKLRLLRILFVSTCFVATTALVTSAQGPPHSPPPPPGIGPGSGAGGMGPGAPPAGSHNSPSKARPDNSGARSSSQLGPVGRWWDDKSVAQTIGLRKEQQKKMDVIFNENKPAILESYKAFLDEQSKYEKISKGSQVDQAALFASIDAVSKARASLQKATAQMLLQIRQQMNVDQIDKLEKLK